MSDTFSNLLYHIVFSTKERRPLISDGAREALYAYIGGILRSEGGVLLEIGGMPDHVHLVVRFRTDVSVAEMVRRIKANSSKWMNQTHKIPGRFEWQAGYAAFSVSESSLPALRAYVQNQREHHARRPFRDELIRLLKKNRVAFDERYIPETAPE